MNDHRFFHRLLETPRAMAMGLSSGALYGRLRGRSAFRAEEIRRLIAVLPDQRPIRFFVDESVFSL